jgi:predicted aldo/keto reductase-like oxidoreductase
MRTIPKRLYKDGVELSVIGFGGIIVVGMEQNGANAIVAEAVRRGVNYFDVAPSYGKGEAEAKLGPALAPFRKQVFLACKTTERTAQGAQKEFEESLGRLRTDHFDLYQFHGLGAVKDVDQILGPGGAAEFVLKAREQGRCRFIGASTHSEEAAMALIDRFPLDSVLFPVNFVCWFQGHFGSRLLEHARRKGVARLALKAMSYGALPKGEPNPYPKCWYKPASEPAAAKRALRFALSQDITAAVTPGYEFLLRLALDCAADFQPLTPDEMSQTAAEAAQLEPIFRSGS